MGETSCVLLPAVLRWNATVNAARQQELARAVGAPDEDLPRFLAGLVDALGLPGRLRDVGIGEEHLDCWRRPKTDHVDGVLPIQN